MNTIDDLIELQYEYDEQHPDDGFMFVDYFMSFEVSELIGIYDKSKGRKISIITNPNGLDRYAVKYG
jgi:hypothetical protein